MRIDADRLVDRGCWISDDRVYAFLSSASAGITEVGFHGPQPASRNSRVFSRTSGVFHLIRTDTGGAGGPLQFRFLDWYAGGASALAREDGDVLFRAEATGNQIIVRIPPGSPRPAIRMDKRGLMTSVHGVRAWTTLGIEGGWLALQFRDLITLDAWMEREGPYAGDFLIPESIRRRIFRRACRSGEGTIDDLRPEFRGTPFPIYDATVTCRVGGPGFRVVENETAWIFLPSLTVTDESTFMIAFAGGSGPSPAEEGLHNGSQHKTRYLRCLAQSPEITVPSHPHLEEFFASYPALVESCIIQEHGVPRATPGGYYWIWAWDAMVTALAGLRWGNTRMAEQTIRFINGHRDVGGEIPMRWTRDLLPLDTQPRGALECLLFSLATENASETENEDLLRLLYPGAVEHLNILGAEVEQRGFFANIGFYPDLPLRFGRSGRSAVAIEQGVFYTFCRLCESAAHRFNDPLTAERSASLAARLERIFLATMWDDTVGFLRDAMDVETGEQNRSFPLFSLLFLHSPAGVTLLRPRLAEAAEFISRHLLTDAGFRTLPSWDPHAQSEPVSGAWYPHWDLYALKVFRRAGRRGETMAWVSAVERTLEALGSCPELLPIDRILAGEREGWGEHGSTSNLNCAAGWYGAITHGLLGLESDPGGLTVIPLSLPFTRLSLRGYRCRGTKWDVEVVGSGETCQQLEVDGASLPGTLKIPGEYYDGGIHRLLIRYGSGRPGPRLRELVNGEVVGVKRGDPPEGGMELTLRTFGRAEIVAEPTDGATVLLDGTPAGISPAGPGLCSFIIPIPGLHRVVIR